MGRQDPRGVHRHDPQGVRRQDPRAVRRQDRRTFLRPTWPRTSVPKAASLPVLFFAALLRALTLALATLAISSNPGIGVV